MTGIATTVNFWSPTEDPLGGMTSRWAPNRVGAGPRADAPLPPRAQAGLRSSQSAADSATLVPLLLEERAVVIAGLQAGCISPDSSRPAPEARQQHGIQLVAPASISTIPSLV
jgi:hypothetical protein